MSYELLEYRKLRRSVLSAVVLIGGSDNSISGIGFGLLGNAGFGLLMLGLGLGNAGGGMVGSNCGS